MVVTVVAVSSTGTTSTAAVVVVALGFLVVAAFALARPHAVIPHGGDAADAPDDVVGELGHEYDVAIAHDADGLAITRRLVKVPDELCRKVDQVFGAAVGRMVAFGFIEEEADVVLWGSASCWGGWAAAAARRMARGIEDDIYSTRSAQSAGQATHGCAPENGHQAEISFPKIEQQTGQETKRKSRQRRRTKRADTLDKRRTPLISSLAWD